jgi:hypothetical protein
MLPNAHIKDTRPEDLKSPTFGKVPAGHAFSGEGDPGALALTPCSCRRHEKDFQAGHRFEPFSSTANIVRHRDNQRVASPAHARAFRPVQRANFTQGADSGGSTGRRLDWFAAFETGQKS